MRISDWSSDVCSSDLQEEVFDALPEVAGGLAVQHLRAGHPDHFAAAIVVWAEGDAPGILRAQVALDRRQHLRAKTLALDHHAHLAVDRKSTRLNSSH